MIFHCPFHSYSGKFQSLNQSASWRLNFPFSYSYSNELKTTCVWSTGTGDITGSTMYQIEASLITILSNFKRGSSILLRELSTRGLVVISRAVVVVNARIFFIWRLLWLSCIYEDNDWYIIFHHLCSSRHHETSIIVRSRLPTLRCQTTCLLPPPRE